MSTWTFETARRVKVAAALAAMVFLPACMGDGGTGAFGLLQSNPKADTAVREVSVYSGGVVVRAPEGYCLDAAHVAKGPSSTVVPLATCSSLTGEGNAPVEPALLTVSVLPRRLGAEQPDADDLAASLAPAKVADAEDVDGIALVRVANPAQAPLPESDPQYWRGAMEINGHLVGLAVYGRLGSDLSGPKGRRLMLDLAEALREASMGGSPASAESAPQAKPDQNLGGFLGGLFRKSG
jgi:hypothetical protein